MARRSPNIDAGGLPQVYSEDAIEQFLSQKLPKSKARHSADLAGALIRAGARYKRYMARQKEWRAYAPRRKRLERIVALVDGLETSLSEMDIISREDFATRVDDVQIETLMGSLRFLRKEIVRLTKGIQPSGRPRELAEEFWISEVADIYENAFGQKPAIGPRRRRGNFYELLKICWNDQRRSGPLSVRQVNRALERRAVKNMRDFV